MAVFNLSFTAARKDDVNVTVVASGEASTPGYTFGLTQSPNLIFPPEFNFTATAPAGVVIQVITPFSEEFDVAVPKGQKGMSIHHGGQKFAVPIVG